MSPKSTKMTGIAQSVITAPPLAGGRLSLGRASASQRANNVSVRSIRFDRRALLLGTASVPLLSSPPVPPAIAGVGADQSSAYSFVLQQDGKPFPLSYLEGKVTVFVNVASE